MIYSPKKIAQGVYLASQGKNQKELDRIGDNLVLWLRRNRLFSKWREIMIQLEETHRRAEGKTLITIVSRTPLGVELTKNISQFYEKRLQLKIEVREIIDSSIIGGFKVVTAEGQMDATLNKQLAELQSHLIN